MLRRILCCAAVCCSAAVSVKAQNAVQNQESAAWRPAANAPAQAGSAAATAADRPAAEAGGALQTASSATSVGAAAVESIARVTPGPAALPNDAGQVWRDYDISPYTVRVTSTNRPEQAIVDWILRETGYEVWHTEPLGILSAGPRTLRVYHTPEMQKTVADLVGRFVSSEAAAYTFSLRVVTLDSPSWRTAAQRLLQPIPVQTPGVNAWLLARENAAILLGELRRRNDYREHNSPYLMVNNGQSTLISTLRGRSYVRDVIARPDAPEGFEPSPGLLDEGMSLEFSPLLSADRRTIDAAIRCDIDQVEKMIPVMLDVPARNLPRQRTKIEAPQMTHYRFHERLRWPIEQVLLVETGMVALPMPIDGAPLVPGVPLPIGNAPARADLLILVECRGPSASAVSPGGASPSARTAGREAKNYRGPY